MIRSVIVDDEMRSCQALSKMLRDYCEDVTVVGMAHTVEDGVRIIHREQPELVFLDIQMPDSDGFQIFRDFDQPTFRVICVTAYDNFALTAFRYAVLDYVLKPVDIDELVRAVDRFRTGTPVAVVDRDAPVKKSPVTPAPHRIAVTTMHDIQFIDIDRIVRLQAERNYTVFYLVDGTNIFVARTLKEYEETLAGASFMRVHHSHIINLNKVVRYIKGKGGYAVLCDGSKVEVSPKKKAEFLDSIRYTTMF
jgi:two-component system LytT family response regulator